MGGSEVCEPGRSNILFCRDFAVKPAQHIPTGSEDGSAAKLPDVQPESYKAQKYARSGLCFA